MKKYRAIVEIEGTATSEEKFKKQLYDMYGHQFVTIMRIVEVK